MYKINKRLIKYNCYVHLKYLFIGFIYCWGLLIFPMILRRIHDISRDRSYSVNIILYKYNRMCNINYIILQLTCIVYEIQVNEYYG